MMLVELGWSLTAQSTLLSSCGAIQFTWPNFSCACLALKAVSLFSGKIKKNIINLLPAKYLREWLWLNAWLGLSEPGHINLLAH